MAFRQITGVRALVAAMAIAASLGVSAKAEAATIQLGFILDRSGSIGQDNWNIITAGLASAVNTFIPVGGADTYEVSVVSFANTASADVSNVIVSDAAARTALANAIAGLSSIFVPGQATNYTAGFATMWDVLNNTIDPAGSTYVNFATDGVPNPAASDGLAERTLMINGGVDNISVEGIGGGVDAANLQSNYCYPAPCDIVAPFNNFPAQGFYIGVADARGYANAIGNKIKVVTGVPEPATLSLLGLGLAGLVARRRKSA